MIKKEGLKRIFNKILEHQVVPLVEAKGFKFKKSNLQFSKMVNGYSVSIRYVMPFSPLSIYDNETLLFEGGFSVSVLNEKYQKWFNDNLTPLYAHAEVWNNHFSAEFKKNGLFPCYSYVDLGELQTSDFYEPTKAQLFKHNVSLALSRNDSNSNAEIPFEDEFIANHLDRILDVAVSFCNDNQMLNRIKTYRYGFDYANFLVFIGDIEAAKLAYMEGHLKLKEKIENRNFGEREDETECQNTLKNFVKFGKEILGLDLSIVEKPKNISINLGLQFCLNDKLDFKETFSLVDSPNGISDCFVNKRGVILITHANDDLVTIWDKEGNLLKELKIDFPGVKAVGYIEGYNIFFVNNHLIMENMEVRKLTPPLVTLNRKKVVPSRYSCANPVFIEEIKQWVVLFVLWDSKTTYVACFYDETYSPVKTLPIKEVVIDIVPAKKWIVTCKNNSHFTLYDFEGNVIQKLESNNARSAIGHSYNSYHCFTNSFSHLFSYSYHVKSQLFNLSDFSIKALWGHTTYEKDYKELYYNNINHNFGITIAKFSPDETYLVAGACHGKYIAWNLPGYERFELIPNAEYLMKMPNAEIVFIGKNRYLKNRNHQMGNIQFWENGEYFSFQINQDTLIFNRQFEHIQTIENSATVKCFGKFATSYKDNKLTILSKISADKALDAQTPSRSTIASA